MHAHSNLPDGNNSTYRRPSIIHINAQNKSESCSDNGITTVNCTHVRSTTNNSTTATACTTTTTTTFTTTGNLLVIIIKVI